MTDILSLIKTLPEDNHARGKQFETLCKWLLETDPTYTQKLRKVWLWDDWPDRWGPDCGIDLVAEDSEGKVWAIQAKCYSRDYDVTKKDIDSFLSESSNEKIDLRLLIATTDRIGPNALSVIQRANSLIPVQQLLLTELLDKKIDWPSSINDLSSGGVKKAYKPRSYQREAINNAVAGFKRTDRGQLIMACGTGKTLVGLWTAEAMEAQTTLVLLPSLLLLSKTLSEWLAHSKEPFSYLPVCSDESVSKSEDAINFKTSDLSFPSTTNEIDIVNFMKKKGRKVIFSTYQSSPQIAKAFKGSKLKPIDLVISDEAHRCAGKAGAAYTTILDNNLIPACHRLFMTATPKIFQAHTLKSAADSGVEVFSMDDEETFGPVFHKISFGEAIEKDLLSDYQVVIVGVDDSMCAEMIEERVLVKTENEIQSDAQSFASHIGLAKALKEYDLRRVITFHSRVSSAKEFQQDFSNVVNWMPKKSRPTGSIVANYASGAMPTSQRNQNLKRLGELAEGERAILSNARCLSEGVDVPALDGVAFIDPRNSEIEIVQAVGRAIRLSSDKSVGTIVIPVFIAEHDDPDEVLNSSVFKKVWAVVNALRSHDEELGIELDNLRKSLGKRGSVGKAKKIHFDLPTTITDEFEKALSLKVIESTTASWEFWLGLLENYKEEHHDCLVPARFKTSDGFALGNWVNSQRTGKDKLIPTRIQRLKTLGFVWDIYEMLWEQGFSHLKNYKEEHNDCLVPDKFKMFDGFNLGSWIGTQRKEKDKLPPEKIQRLNELGFVWDVLEHQWEQAIFYLTAYKNHHADCLVPAKYKTSDGFALGNWVRNQRREKNKLTQTRVQHLEAIGFIWDPFEQIWEQSFSYLKAYKEGNGNCLVPYNFKTLDGFDLGKWIVRQRTRKNKLTTERIHRLEELGISWDKLDQQWEQGFAYLRTYQKKHGDCLVPFNYKTSDGFALGGWVNTQRTRKDKLIPTRFQRLETLGFVWDKIERQWEQGYTYLRAYKNQHNDCLVPTAFKTSDGYALGNWVGNQRTRKDKLSPEKFQRLEALGFVWNKNEHRLEQGISYLRTYQEKHGNCSVPSEFKTSDGFALGAWVVKLRGKKDKLSTENIEQLDALGFIWQVKK